MKINLHLIFFCCILAFFSSCVKEFNPTIKKYNELLVVDGTITDAPGPYTIKLSRSSPVKEFASYTPYPNCSVEILDDQGNKELLNEVSPGVYKTDSLNGIQGIVGRKYKVAILTPDGEAYESQEELLIKGTDIKSIYAEQEHKTDPKLFYGRDGYQFYVDADIPEKDTSFYLWQLESTYKFKTDFPIRYYYEGGGVIKPFPWPDSLRTGYRSDKIKEIFVFNTSAQNQSQAIHFPLNYEDNYTKALTIRYCLKVSQYTLNKSAYTYWHTIKKILDSQGELYTQQPFQVKNNIINVTSPDKPALGYFMAAGLSEKRIFVDPPWIAFRYDVCGIDQGPFHESLLQELLKTNADQWPIYLFDKVPAAFYMYKECMDCRVKGFLKKPDFWIN